MDEENKNSDESTPFEEALNKTGNGLYNVLLAGTCGFVLLGIGMDLLGVSLVVEAACELRLTVPQKGVLTSLPFVGIFLVSYMWGYISDTRGRRFTLVLCLQASFVLSCLSSLSPHWILLAVMKFLSVCFSCAANSVTYTLVGESCTQRIRSKYMLIMTSFLILSPGVAAVLAYPVLNLKVAVWVSWLGITISPWRLLILALACINGISGTAIYFFYESPKFLANSGKPELALDVLKKIYKINHRHDPDGYKVKSLKLEEVTSKKQMSFIRNLFEQSAPLFRAPYLWKTLRLYYIMGVVYITNNSFLMWLPYIFNLVSTSLRLDNHAEGNICSLISTKDIQKHYTTNSTVLNNAHVQSVPLLCHEKPDNTVILIMICSQTVYSLINLGISYLPHRRKVVLICILCLSALSGFFINWSPEPISSVVLFVVFAGTCVAMGILASYFVDLYPTSYRGMVSCLSIMVGRTCAFIGINLVGQFLFSYCHATFYVFSCLVLSSAVAAWFLPPDKPLEKKPTSV